MKSSHIRHIFSNMSTTFRVLIVLLFLICVISIIYFVRGIRDVRHDGLTRPHNPLGIIFSGSRQPIGVATLEDIDTIDVWMTFEYTSYTFHLDESILRDSLGIENPRYPKLTLRSYIKQENLDRTLFLDEIKEIVRTHFLQIPIK